MNKPHVTIIILNWNGINDTLSLLDNLERVTYPNFSVLVTDNASTDSSIEKLTMYKKESNSRLRLAILALQKNFGFAEGNNKAIEENKNETDYYLLLNNDTIVAPDFLDRLVRVCESEPKLGAVGPKIYFASVDGKKQNQIWYAGGWLNFFAGGAHHYTVDKPLINDQAYRETEFLTGCCLLIKREVVYKLHTLFDPSFFAYGEDVDLSLRIDRLGYRLGYVPGSKVWHKLATSSGGAKSYNFWYYNVRNNWLIMTRYAQWYHWPIFVLYFLCYKPVLWSLTGAIVRPRRDKWYRLLAIIRGTLDARAGHYGQRKS